MCLINEVSNEWVNAEAEMLFQLSLSIIILIIFVS